MHVKGAWDLQIKEMVGTHFILCKQDMAYLQMLSELGKGFKTGYIVFCPKSKYFALCILQRALGVTRLPGRSSYPYALTEMTPGQSHPIELSRSSVPTPLCNQKLLRVQYTLLLQHY